MAYTSPNFAAKYFLYNIGTQYIGEFYAKSGRDFEKQLECALKFLIRDMSEMVGYA